jgi:hypothetical protein
MANLAKVVQQLRNERNQAQNRLEQVDAALKALTGLNSGRGKSNRAHADGGRRRPMSPAARKRIAAAQRARWAKWKASKRSK